MCGIAGIIHKQAMPISPALLAQMTDLLAHRGPDGRGFLLADATTAKSVNYAQQPPALSPDMTPTIGLGHRRLSIIDLDSGQQPMCNEDGMVWVVFNGEIYNFQALRTELEGLGHRFRSDHSDTEVILHGYEQWGPACVQRFNGMWAFALVDLRQRQIMLARDRLGKKPLYYYATPDRLVFASELKSILCDPTVPREMDLIAMADYLSYGYVAAPRTIFKHISKLPHAHYLMAHIGSRIHLETPCAYWDVQYAPDYSTDLAEWCIQLNALLREAVQCRLVSDVPLGAFLSGGIDSSLIVSLMSEVQPAPVKTFSIGFEEDQYNELPYARQIAEKYKTEHHEEIIRPDVFALLPQLVRQYDEPFGDSSAIPTYYVSQMARKHVTVALSGDAGDELFAGYNRYERAMKYHQYMDWLPDVFRRLLFGWLPAVIPDKFRGHGAARLLALNARARYEFMVGAPVWKKYLSPDFTRAVTEATPAGLHYDRFWSRVPDADYVTQMQYVDMNTYLTEDILVKVDRASMLNSLEVRVPLLDHRVVEFAARIPVDFKLNGKDKKFLIKHMMKETHSRDFLYRPKSGFAVPLNRWFREDWQQPVRDILLNRQNFISQYFDQNAVEKLLNDHQAGFRDFSPYIWRVLFLESWAQTYPPEPVKMIGG